MEASKAYQRERFADALKAARQVLANVPDLAAGLELAGLCLYRMERWAAAAKDLERFVELTGSTEQHAVLADCHRALRHYGRVAELWEDLASSSPTGGLVAEGRIVAAGALADQGRFRDAIALLERAPLVTKRPKEHHFRLWYALADLYERAGEGPRARELFLRLAKADPEFADVAERAASLGSSE